ncbi:CPBP family intramembrane glutamic endopeptidase [Halobellus limi]|uniref:CPBP family intramembrane metalloprotease n=1 Tax=Halobellus limi TaxID=699433 RepID=A0A1H6CHH0_9EURY|nr:CPBP family intramembrane glutamic endopeptidase [Halobellus limi]QCC49552.1 CPBP family intramembrane metalloprotease [Halobellus limi]SEG71826.1 Membrane protease YdiL, CAAX protease family [Halobellus limi]
MIREVVERRRLTSFFLLAYALAWGVEAVPDVVGMTQPSWTSWFFAGFLSALAPSVAAAIVVWASDESVRGWFRSVAKVRVHWRWYVAAIAVPFLIVYAAGVVSWAIGGPIDWSAFEVSPTTIVFGIVIGTLLGGGQEEFGWRGFAQPELQERYGAFRAAIVVGVFWGLWHLPQFLPGGFRADWGPLMVESYFVGIIGFSVLLAWVFNGSGGSAWLAMVMHGADNATQGRLPIDLSIVAPDGVLLPSTLVTINVPHAILTWLIALIIVGVVGTALYRDRVRGHIAGISPAPGGD